MFLIIVRRMPPVTSDSLPVSLPSADVCRPRGRTLNLCAQGDQGFIGAESGGEVDADGQAPGGPAQGQAAAGWPEALNTAQKGE
jgi:hypothetical protein